MHRVYVLGRYMLYFLTESMGRIMPPFRQLYQETISDLQMELKAALVDLGENAFDLLLKVSTISS
jgi:hypothetical protein